MLVVKEASNDSSAYPVIDRRLLAAAERNGEYLGLTEWLQEFGGKTRMAKESRPQQR